VGQPFVGSEAVAAGEVLKSALRTRYTKVFRNVYVSPGTEVTAEVRAHAAWLWSGRKGVIAGSSASALHGAKWVDDDTTTELFHTNRNPMPGLRVRSGILAEDEWTLANGIPVTTPARTVFDLACWYPTVDAVAQIDALAQATEVKMADIELLMQRYPRRPNIRRARTALELVDRGAQSPKETWLRLLLVDAGLPRPQTQIPVHDENGETLAYLDMGWKDLKVAAEYDGDQHRTSRRQYRWDVRRMEMLERRGWIVVRITAGDPASDIVRRVRAALASRASR
jgi:hypothetical protein